MPLSAPVTLGDLIHAYEPAKADVTQLRNQAITTLNNGNKSLDDMRLVDEEARSVLGHTLSRVEYLAQMVRCCNCSGDAIVKMFKVVLPGSIEGSAARLVVEVLYIELVCDIIAFPPYTGSSSFLDHKVKRIRKLLAVTLAYARTTGYMSCLHDITFQTMHLTPSTCPQLNDFYNVSFMQTRTGANERAERIALVWDAQVAEEVARHQAWMGQVVTLLLKHTPLANVLVDLTTIYV
jgi:hypothetical protein